MRITDEGAANLAAAIVEQAVRDWLKAQRAARRRKTKIRLDNDTKDNSPRTYIRSAESFFRSQWFGILVDLDGEELLRRLRQHPERDGRSVTYRRYHATEVADKYADKVGKNNGRRKKQHGPPAPDG